MTRVVYVDDDDKAAKLANPNPGLVAIVDVRAMCRDNPDDNRKYIQAYLQGMLEGTIEASDDKRKLLELSAKMDGLLAQKSMRLNVTAALDSKSVEDLLGSFRPTRHGKAEVHLAPGKKQAQLPGETDDG